MSDPLMDGAWLSFMRFAVEKPEIIAEFNKATGQNLKSISVDDADAFVCWVTEHYWGVDEAPDKVREAIAARAVVEAQAKGLN